MEQLEGKVAVVTGGGSGIGEGIARACADAGMRVVIADIEADAGDRVANALREAGTEAIAVRTDVTDRAALDELADAAWEAFGAVHLLCNNAGVISVGEIASTTPEDWQWLFGVNVFGVVHGIQAFVPRMREQIAALGRRGAHREHRLDVQHLGHARHRRGRLHRDEARRPRHLRHAAQ